MKLTCDVCHHTCRPNAHHWMRISFVDTDPRSPVALLCGVRCLIQFGLNLVDKFLVPGAAALLTAVVAPAPGEAGMEQFLKSVMGQGGITTANGG